tara:strand:+ start:759 stop:872 length:114 start_codon:yes stop_codon:yes gene_type:complete
MHSASSDDSEDVDGIVSRENSGKDEDEAQELLLKQGG